MGAGGEAVEIAAQCRRQAGWCAGLGSSLYAALLERVAEDVTQGGPARALLLTPHTADDPKSALALRLMGAVHRLVLEGKAPGLARWYPSAGGVADANAAWPALQELLSSERERLAPLLARGVQTNDPGRSGSLLGGFLFSAQRYGKPLRLLELGASAGLNLCWDRYRYEWDGGAWGDAASPVRLRHVFRSRTPAWPERVEVVEREGCDLRPIDATSREGQLTLRSYVWADQQERMQRLEAACAVAAHVRPLVVEQGAGDWLEQVLAEPRSGVTAVVFHSVVWQYLPAAEQARVAACLETAGARATADGPLVWLRLEPAQGGSGPPLLTWRGFPGGTERTLARSSYHAPHVEWLDAE